MGAWVWILAALAGMSLVFTLGWLWARQLRNYSLVDALWAFGIGVTALAWLGRSGNFQHPKILVAGLLIGLWSFRLGGYLQARIRRGHPEEDARYQKLRELWKSREAMAFFLFFQAQALSVVILALPFLMISLDLDPTWTAWETAGLVVALVGIAGEGIADRQMARYKKSNPGSGGVCRAGLWGWSRHPNYFFEAVTWFGFYAYACGSGWGWATVHAPLAILFLLLRVTGIPPSEAAALRRKGDAYREYQQTVSAFIPLPPRAHSSSNPHSS
jgi:steroid 5-alpha reductase family enzyme